MTAGKHPFECPEPSRYRRLKLESLVEQTTFKITRLCQATVRPVRHPQTPLPVQPRAFVLPAHARWFDFKRIHAIERASFPELVDDQSEHRYRRIRNRAVKLFRLYPTVVVTPATLRHMCGGDMKLILRIHRFLVLWGLINFMSTFKDTTDHGDSRFGREFASLVEGPMLNVVQKTMNATRAQEVNCSTCRTACGEGHFMAKKYPGIVICPLCFSHHNTLDQLDASHAAFDFHTLPKRPSQPMQASTEFKEDRAMFDAFEDTKGDWMAISDACTSRSPIDCMIGMVRHSVGDVITSRQATSHEFNDQPALFELVDFAEQTADCDKVSVAGYRSDWRELEGELSLMEKETRACIAT